MGWSSANPIFDAVAVAMLQANVSHDKTVDVLAVLIDELRNGDWDTYDESYYAFEDEPAVVEAFRRAIRPNYPKRDDDEEGE
jgi:hypothetical protein